VARGPIWEKSRHGRKILTQSLLTPCRKAGVETMRVRVCSSSRIHAPIKVEAHIFRFPIHKVRASQVISIPEDQQHSHRGLQSKQGGWVRMIVPSKVGEGIPPLTDHLDGIRMPKEQRTHLEGGQGSCPELFHVDAHG
jgi:hypothetical protein